MKKNINYHYLLLVRIIYVLWIACILIFAERSETSKYVDIVTMILVSFAGFYVLYLKKIRLNIHLLNIWIFSLFFLASTLWANNQQYALTRNITVCTLVIIICILYQFFHFNKDEIFVVKGLAIAGIILSVYTVYFYGLGEFINILIEGKRMGIGFINSNTLGMYCALTIIICVFFGLNENKKNVYWILILPMIIVFASGSRKALVTMFLGIIMVYILIYDSKKSINVKFKEGLFIIIMVAVCICVLKLPIFEPIVQRFNSMINITNSSNMMNTDSSTLERIKMFEIGWIQFSKTPFLGIGIGCSGILTFNEIGYFTYLHNNYIELLATVGIIGTLLFYNFYYHIFKKLKNMIKDRDSLAIITFIILTIQIFMDFGSVSYFSKTTYIYFLVGILTVTRKKNDEVNIK